MSYKPRGSDLYLPDDSDLMVLHDIGVLQNPVARKGKARKQVDQCVRELRAHNIDVTVYLTDADPQKTRDTIYEMVSNNHQANVSAGGDGTSKFMIDTMVMMGLERRLLVGTMPVGTGCDWGQSLGQKRNDPKQWVHAFTNPLIGQLDVGYLEFDGFYEHFIDSVGIQMAATTLKNRERLKNSFGNVGSYLVGATLALQKMDTVRADIAYTLGDTSESLNGVEVYDLSFQNCRKYAWFMEFSEYTSHDTGILDAFLFRDFNEAGSELLSQLIKLSTEKTDITGRLWDLGMRILGRDTGAIGKGIIHEPLSKVLNHMFDHGDAFSFESAYTRTQEPVDIQIDGEEIKPKVTEFRTGIKPSVMDVLHGSNFKG